jgi:hypothetical protein
MIGEPMVFWPVNLARNRYLGEMRGRGCSQRENSIERWVRAKEALPSLCKIGGRLVVHTPFENNASRGVVSPFAFKLERVSEIRLNGKRIGVCFDISVDSNEEATC